MSLTSDQLRLLRWIGVVIVVLVALVGSSLGWWNICEDQLASAGTEGVVKVCQPPGLTDLPVIAALLLCLILIAPELSEVGVPGLLTLKRKLDDQEDKIADQSESIERQEEALGSLQSTVDQVVQTMQAVEVQQAQQQEQKQAAELKALQTQNLTVVLNDAARKSDLGDDQLIPQVEDSQVVTPRRAQMESRLLRAWERLKHWVRPVSGQSSLDDIPWQSPILARMSGLFDKWSEGSKGGFLKEEIRGYWAKQKAWNERFAKEIELVYAARNTVAHPRQDTALSDEKLSEALRLADILIYTAERELRESFERARGEAGKQALKFGELMSAGTALHHHRRAQMRQGQTMKPDRLAI